MQPHIRSLETALDIKRDINTYFHIRYKMQGSSTPAWLDIFYTSQSATPLYFIECLLNLYILLCDHSIRACFQLDQFVTRRYALSLGKADGSRTQTTTTHTATDCIPRVAPVLCHFIIGIFFLAFLIEWTIRPSQRLSAIEFYERMWPRMESCYAEIHTHTRTKSEVPDGRNNSLISIYIWLIKGSPRVFQRHRATIDRESGMRLILVRGHHHMYIYTFGCDP